MNLNFRYRVLIQKNPEVLTYLSSLEVAEALLGRAPTPREISRLRRETWQRHPRIPTELTNARLPKKTCSSIWGLNIRGQVPQEGKIPQTAATQAEIQKACKWWEKRHDIAAELGLKLEHKVLRGLTEEDFKRHTLEELATRCGCSRERIRQLRNQFRLPKRWQATQAVRETFGALEVNLDSTQLEPAFSEAGELQERVRVFLRGKKKHQHPIYSADLRLRTTHLCHIYRVTRTRVTLARRLKGGARAEPHHPQYQQFLQEEKTRAELRLKNWNILYPNTRKAEEIQYDWSKTDAELERETGISRWAIRTSRELHGVVRKAAPKPKEPGTQKPPPKKRAEIILNLPEDLQKRPREVWERIGKPITLGSFRNRITKLRKKAGLPLKRKTKP